MGTHSEAVAYSENIEIDFHSSELACVDGGVL
jgi:hypothetical protein